MAVIPVVIMLPTVSLSVAAAHPVRSRVTSFAVSGIERISPIRPISPTSPTSQLGTLGPASVAAAFGTVQTAVLTGPRDTTRFDLVALSWKGVTPAGNAVAVRVRESGVWTPWQDLAAEGDGPDPGTAEALATSTHATAPLLTAGADGVQVRVESATGAAPSGLRVDLVDGGRSDADADTGPVDSAAAATGQPRIITRAQWGADERLVKAPPTINPTVKVLFLHHTDTTNSYSAAQAYAQLRSIYTFHTKVRGWNDIGYNFLVDRYGRVFEGRRGSLTQAVQGAHTGGFNEDSLGIAVLGTFSTATVPQAVIRAIVDVTSWKAAAYALDPRGTTTLISAGSGYTKYRTGTVVRFATISGHRDADLTACPGDALYAKLPAIRRAVAQRMVPGLVSPRASTAQTSWPGTPVTVQAAIPTVQRWSLRVTRICDSQPLRTLSGRSTGSIAVSWDLHDGAGAPVPPGVYRLTLITDSPVGSGPRWTGDVEVLPTATSPPATCRVVRLGVPDLYAASVIAGHAAYPDSHSVVLVGVGASVEGLVAAPLAHARQAPLLLTAAAGLPAPVAADISARGVSSAWIVGGPDTVAPAVEQQLQALGVTSVVRLAGADRYGTAAAVARATGAAGAGAGGPAAVVVSGEDGRLWDAAVAAGPAAATGRPVLLVTARGVPAETASALRDLGVTQATIVGGQQSVPTAVIAQLVASGVRSTVRVAGADRYATAVAVARTFAGVVPAGPVVVVPADDAGFGWTTIGAAQARLTVLADASAVPAATFAWLATLPPSYLSIAADPRYVSTAVLRRLYAAKR